MVMVISRDLEQRLVRQMSEQVNTVERARSWSHDVLVGRHGVRVYADTGTTTNDYGITIENARNWTNNPGMTRQEFADKPREWSYRMINEHLREHLGIDQLPLAIQGQMMDFAVHRTGPPVATLNNLLVDKGYLRESDRINMGSARVMNLGVTVNRYPRVAEAAERYYQDVGAVEFNNEYSEARAQYYDRQNGRFERPFMRRAAQWEMDKSLEQYRAEGFVVVGDKVMLPEPVMGRDGVASVNIPGRGQMHYDQWYGEYMLAHGCGNGTRSRALQGAPPDPVVVATSAPAVQDGRAPDPSATRTAPQDPQVAANDDRNIRNDKALVRQMQAALGTDVDGIWGRDTQAKYEAFERSMKSFKADGLASRTEVNFLLASDGDQLRHQAIIDNTALVSAIQRRVGCADIDGIWGPKTQAKYEAYERARPGTQGDDGLITAQEVAQMLSPTPTPAPRHTGLGGRDMHDTALPVNRR